MAQPGRFHGFAGWFEAQLTDDVTLSNYPPGTPAWDNLFFPLLNPLNVVPGRSIQLELKGRDAEGQSLFWFWSTEVREGEPCEDMPRSLAHARQSTFLGTPRSFAQIRKQAIDHRPMLNVEGQIERFILTLMDGQHTLGDIAHQVVRQFPTSFSEEREALRQIMYWSRQYSCSSLQT